MKNCFALFSYVVYRLPGTARTQALARSKYFVSLAGNDRPINAAYLKELYNRNDPEEMIRLFESQPSLHSDQSAIAQYVKALVKADRLEESE